MRHSWNVNYPNSSLAHKFSVQCLHRLRLDLELLPWANFTSGCVGSNTGANADTQITIITRNYGFDSVKNNNVENSFLLAEEMKMMTKLLPLYLALMPFSLVIGEDCSTKTDGGWVPENTACVFPFTLTRKGKKTTFTDCVSLEQESPYMGTTGKPKEPSDSGNAGFWCATTKNYNPGFVSTRKKWGYCKKSKASECQPRTCECAGCGGASELDPGGEFSVPIQPVGKTASTYAYYSIKVSCDNCGYGIRACLYDSHDPGNCFLLGMPSTTITQGATCVDTGTQWKLVKAGNGGKIVPKLKITCLNEALPCKIRYYFAGSNSAGTIIPGINAKTTYNPIVSKKNCARFEWMEFERLACCTMMGDCGPNCQGTRTGTSMCSTQSFGPTKPPLARPTRNPTNYPTTSPTHSPTHHAVYPKRVNSKGKPVMIVRCKESGWNIQTIDEPTLVACEKACNDLNDACGGFLFPHKVTSKSVCKLYKSGTCAGVLTSSSSFTSYYIYEKVLQDGGDGLISRAGRGELAPFFGVAFMLIASAVTVAVIGHRALQARRRKKLAAKRHWAMSQDEEVPAIACVPATGGFSPRTPAL